MARHLDYRRRLLAGAFLVFVAAIALVLAGDASAADWDDPTVASPGLSTPVVTTISLPAGANPYAIAVDSTLGEAFVLNSYAQPTQHGSVSVINAQNSVTTYPFCGALGLATGCGVFPDGIAVDQRFGTIDVSDGSGCDTALDEANNLVVDSSTNAFQSFFTSPQALGIYSPTQTVYVAVSNSATNDSLGTVVQRGKAFTSELQFAAPLTTDFPDSVAVDPIRHLI